jgi:predicted phosphodiesterase
MKIRLLSDLHLESRQWYEHKNYEWAQYNGEDVLVLAGDIDVGAPAVISALNYFYKQGFPEIIYVAGNHECYRHHYTEMDAVKRYAKDMTHIHMLDCNEVVKIKDVSFFGGTLWTGFKNGDHMVRATASRYINDFRIVSDWDINKAQAEYERQSGLIKYYYENTPGKKVIVTHFLPAMECVAERYKNNKEEVLLNYYFANDLGSWISELSDTTWLFGHTHDSVNMLLGNTCLISNPLGYPSEEIPEFAKFNPMKVIEV